MNKRLLIVALGLLGRVLFAQTPSEADIRKILTDRIDTQKQSVGIVVGVIDDQGRRVVAHGHVANGSEQKVDGDTLFEIGSVTKVFTSLVLADMAQKGEVVLTDPVAKYLPQTVKMPERSGKAITLEQLAAHTSGLPRLPANLAPQDPRNPYADYDADKLYAFLSSHELARDPGSQSLYSNLGAGLLAHALSLRVRTDLETLFRKRIFDPLAMKSTSLRVPARLEGRLATGHDPALQRVPGWDFDVLAGAGAAHSTANDLLTFLAAAMGMQKTPLAKAMTSMTATRHKTDAPGIEVGLAWHISNVNGREIVWHNGGTGGFRSFIGFDPRRHIGVVVLSNAFTPAGIDDIGLHLLEPSSKLLAPPVQRTEIKLDPKILEGYVGRYRLAPQFVLTVTREGGQLFVQATNQGRLEVFASAEREFFYKVVDAQLTFETDQDGRATRVILHQNGRDVPGERIPDEP